MTNPVIRAMDFDPRLLPPISPLSNQVLLLDLDDALAEKVLIRVVESDPQLAVRLVGIANSAAYAHFGAAKETVAMAVRRIGLVRCRQLAIGILFAGPFRSRLPERIAEGLWLHALTMAAAAQEIARIKKSPFQSWAYLAGLSHDLGYMVEEVCESGTLKRNAETSIEARLSLEQAEQRLLGTDHSILTERVLRAWAAPEEICAAIAQHHDLDIDPESLAAIVYGAEKLARFSDVTELLYFGHPHPFSEASIDRDGLDFLFDQQLNLTSEEVSQLVTRIVEQVESFQQCAPIFCGQH